MENDKAERLERIKTKTKQLQDLILQQIAFKENNQRLKQIIKSQITTRCEESTQPGIYRG